MLSSSAVLVGLGKALNVSLDFLMSSQVEKITNLEFRRRYRAPASDLAQAEACLIDHLERYLAIEHILDIPATSGWVEYPCCDSVTSEAEVDDRANLLRHVWQLGMGPIPSLCALLEEKGVKVIQDDLPESVNGFTCQAFGSGKPVAQVIMISTQTTVERKRFTLAHELAHRIIRLSDTSEVKLEPAMNRFAGAFLMPAESLQAEVGVHRHRITYYEIMYLKNMYGVSSGAVSSSRADWCTVSQSCATCLCDCCS